MDKKYVPVDIEFKKCVRCEQLLEIYHFQKNCRMKDGYSRECKSCIKKLRLPYKEKYNECSRKWRQANPEKNTTSKRNWEKNNPDKHNNFKNRYRETMHKKQAEWYKINAKRHSENTTKRKKERIENDPNYKIFIAIKDQMRHLYRRLFNKRNFKIKKSEILGESKELLLEYIISKFDKNNPHPITGEEMSLDNYGLWHIDHIKPLAAFPFEQCKNIEELKAMFKEAFHHTNLQPLWAIHNIKKSSVFNGVKYKLKLPEIKIDSAS